MKPGKKPRQIPKRTLHTARKKRLGASGKKNRRLFNYDLDYESLDLRKKNHLYRVGRGEQGVLLVEPYKSEILPFWRFRTPEVALRSARRILRLFRGYRAQKDFVGMDMARKFLQMGFTRPRRYANHSSGRKYDQNGDLLDFDNDPVKAQSAKIFWKAWKQVEADPAYSFQKIEWKNRLG